VLRSSLACAALAKQHDLGDMLMSSLAGVSLVEEHDLGVAVPTPTLLEEQHFVGHPAVLQNAVVVIVCARWCKACR
jgi:hypothetical protein